jgi:hypothetical protein
MINLATGDDVVLAYNPSSTQRNPISLAASLDGLTWTDFAVLANNASVSESCLPELMCCIDHVPDPTPLQIGQQIFTVYSDSTNNGIMLAISSLP